MTNQPVLEEAVRRWAAVWPQTAKAVARTPMNFWEYDLSFIRTEYSKLMQERKE